MSKVIRTGRVSGGGVVTLGRSEEDLFLDPSAAREKAPAIDLDALLAARVQALREGLVQEWEGRLRQEHDTMRAAGERQLAESEERQRTEVERIQKGRYEEGYRAGVAAKEGEAREAVHRLGDLHEAMKADRAQVLLEAETLVADLAVALARRVTRVRAQFDPTVVARTVRAGLKHLSEVSSLVIKVHAEDLQVARRFVAAWVERVDTDAVLKVQVSDHVDRGGCLIEGGEDHVDARLEAQLDILQQALHDEIEAGAQTRIEAAPESGAASAPGSGRDPQAAEESES